MCSQVLGMRHGRRGWCDVFCFAANRKSAFHHSFRDRNRKLELGGSSMSPNR